MIGNFRKNPITTGKKSPNKFINPNASIAIPTNGYFKKTRIIPPRNAKVPRIFSFREKKLRVLATPIINNRPDRNKILPIASSPPSKNNKTPRNMKNSPKAVNPTPISLYYLNKYIL